MQLTCPACRKANEIRPGTAIVCQRCGCDLSSLVAVRRAAAAHLGSGVEALRLGDWEKALDCAERSWELCHSAEAAQLATLACGGLQHTEPTVEWHRRATAAASAG